MTNLRDVRLRMRAIQQTLQVTKAMNLISTAKLRKGRRLLQDMEPYFIRIQKAMFDILTGTTMNNSKFINPPIGDKPPRTAIVVMTSDKGLAGGYNANIFRQVNQFCPKIKNPVLILIGAIGYRHFLHSPWLILENFSFRSRLPDLDNAKEIADYLVSQYLGGMFDEIHIVYTHMYGSVKLLPRVRQLLPLNENKMQEEFIKDGEMRKKRRLEYWPSTRKVFDALVPMYIKGIIYGSLVESYVSEQSARMFAMDEASKSAHEMLAALQLHYNRARQAGITQEITEIVGGAEALSE